MIKINKIYTKTGDGGTTGLVDGPRRQKDDLRIEAYGTVEEANATVGLARLHSKDMARPTTRWRVSRTICSIWARTLQRLAPTRDGNTRR